MFQVFIRLIIVGWSLGYSGLSGATSPPPNAPLPGSVIPTVIEEGKQYHRFGAGVLADKGVQELMLENPGKIQVIEFFNYDCFWCGRLQPIIHEWVAKNKPENVVFLRFPLVFNKKWEVLAKAFLVTKALGKSETLDPLFFNEIHQQRIDLSDMKLLTDFFVKNGVSEKQFLDLYNSFTINQELLQSTKLADAFQISVSPVIVINGPSGSFSVTAKVAGGEQAVITVLDYVVSRESKKLGAS